MALLGCSPFQTPRKHGSQAEEAGNGCIGSLENFALRTRYPSLGQEVPRQTAILRLQRPLFPADEGGRLHALFTFLFSRHGSKNEAIRANYVFTTRDLL